MRIFLRTLAWLFALAAVFRSGLAGFTVWLAASRDSVPWNISVGNLIADHVTFLNWVSDFGKAIFPSQFIDGILDKPALLMLPVGALGAAVLAYICFRFSR